MLLLLITLSISVSSATDPKLQDEFDHTSCEAQLNHYSVSLSKREPWALDLFDSWTKFQSGVSHGNRVDFGNFEHCLDFKYDSTSSEIGLIQGQHCLIYYRATPNASLTHQSDGIFDWSEIGWIMRQWQLRLGGGICLPSSCSATKIQSFVNKFLEAADLQITNDYDQSSFCHTSEFGSLRAIDIVAIVVLSIFAVLMTTSTFYDIYTRKQNRSPCQFYSSFSIYRNGQKLFNIARSQSNETIHCFHGLRVISILWILMGSRYAFTAQLPMVNANQYTKWLDSTFSTIVNGHSLGADTFFTISGCLMAWTFMKHFDTKSSSIPRMYLHRYLRITPVFAVLILLSVSILRHYGSDPLQTVKYKIFGESCEKYWWSALLHVQNYVNPERLCLKPSFFLSIDMQLFWLCPLLLYPAFKYGWKYLWVLPTIVALTEVCSFVISLKYYLIAFPTLNTPEAFSIYLRKVYYPTHIRLGPTLVSFCLGYQLYVWRNQRISINKTLNILLWITSFSIMSSIIFGLLPLQQIDTKHHVGHAFYIALIRSAWNYALVGLIFCCVYGKGGVVKWFLELPVFQPLGRMGLSFFLVSDIYRQYIPQMQPEYFSNRSILHQFCGDFVVTYILASILYVAVEAPILAIEQSFYNKESEIGAEHSVKLTQEQPEIHNDIGNENDDEK